MQHAGVRSTVRSAGERAAAFGVAGPLALWAIASFAMGCAVVDGGSHHFHDGEGGAGGDGSSTVVTTTGSNGSSVSTGSGWPGGCDVYGSDVCGSCLESKCCSQIEACMEDSACASCLQGDTTTGCGALYETLVTCATTSCGPVMHFHQGSNCGGESPCNDVDHWEILENPCHYPPPQWTCNASEYDQAYSDPTHASCQCDDCGFWDPDCDGNTHPNDCGAGYVCNGGIGPCSGCTPDGVACQ